jgi:hypothetical protein
MTNDTTAKAVDRTARAKMTPGVSTDAGRQLISGPAAQCDAGTSETWIGHSLRSEARVHALQS